jgi:hypothetical protein
MERSCAWPTIGHSRLHALTRPPLTDAISPYRGHQPAHPGGTDDTTRIIPRRKARASGAAIFPLSAPTYMELFKIASSRQRDDLAAVMEELSGFLTLLDRVVVMALEVRAGLDALIGDVPSAPLPLIGRGVGHAFGVRGGLRLVDEAGRDLTDEAVASAPDGASRRAAAETLMERMLLQGPREEDLPALRDMGYDPYAAINVAERRAEQQELLRRQLDKAREADDQPDWRRGRLRDVVAVREFVHELRPTLERELPRRGLDWSVMMPDRETSRAFIRGMPSTEVAVTLLTERHRDAARSWTSNDIIDIDAMALAVPYCDAVVADKAIAHALTSSGVARRMGTLVLRSLTGLRAHLASAA